MKSNMSRLIFGDFGRELTLEEWKFLLSSENFYISKGELDVIMKYVERSLDENWK